MTKYTNSPLVSHTRISPTTYGRRTLPITNIVPHHTAGVIGIENLGGWFAKRTTRASSNYGIGSDGRIGMYCEEKNMACTTSSYWADARAVTIEVSNSATGGQWPISNLALEATIKLITDICARNGIYPCTYTGDLRGTLWRHDWFANKVCPGPYFGSKFLYIAQEVTKRLDILRSGGKTKPIQTSPTYYNYPPGSYEILRTIYTYDKPSGKVKGKIVKGTKVRAIKEVRSGVPGVWLQLDDGRYIQAQKWRAINVKKIAAAKPTTKQGIDGRTSGTWQVTARIGVNVRTEPSTDGDIVAAYQKGQKVNIHSTVTAEGYIWGQYIGATSGQKRYVALGTTGGARYGKWV